MSNQYTFEIENFNGGKNLTIDVDSVAFPQFSHLSVTAVGASQKATEQAKELTIIRKFDEKTSHLFTLQIGRSFPKAILEIRSLSSGKSYLFTFLKPFLDSFYIFKKGSSDENLEQIKFSFDEFSVKENSPVGTAARPKSSDKKAQAMMNLVKG